MPDGCELIRQAPLIAAPVRLSAMSEQRGDSDGMISKKKTLDVIIPVYKPGKEWEQLLLGLAGQTRKPDRILVMNTGKEYWKSKWEQMLPGMEVFHITPAEFDHGGTRDRAARMSQADYLLFMTQDAVPADPHLIGWMMEAMETAPDVRAAYARQLPRPDCRIEEQYTRRFNYPEESCVKRKSDLSQLGIKTYFCSNVCAVYDRETYCRLGGFPTHAIFNEDMIFAARLIQNGYAVAYAAKARVIHSHNYSAIQQFHRNFDLAVSQADHPEVFSGIRSEGEGIRLVKNTAAFLIREGKSWRIVGLIWNSGWKYLGFLLGKRYRKLPRGWVLCFTMNRRYWEKERKNC